MGLFDGLLGGGSGSSAADDLYAGLLTPQQLAAIRQRSAGDDLLKLAGAFAQAGQASRLPTGGIGSALGQAASSLAGSGDEGILKFLQAQKLGAEVLDKKSLAEARKAYLADLLKSGSIPAGFLGGAAPGAGGAPGAAGEAPGAPTGDGSAPSGGSTTASGQAIPFGPDNPGSLAMAQPPEVQEQVAKRIATTAGLQHWAPFNPKLSSALAAAGLPLSGPISDEQWTVASPLIQRYESAGGQNIPNYRFDAGHTAGGPFQITNQTWRGFGGPMPGQGGSASAGPDSPPGEPRSLDELRGIVAGLQPRGGGGGPYLNVGERGPAPLGGLLGEAYPNDPRRFGGAASAGGLLERGTSGSSAQAGSYSPDFFVGDSLSVQAANAYRQQGGNAQAIAKSGISPQAILDNVNQALAQNPDMFRGKNVVVTSGSNDVGQLAQVEETVQRLRAAGANVTLGGVSNEHSRLATINPDLQEIANRQGAAFAPLPSTQGDRELVHPYGKVPEFLRNIRAANAPRSGGSGSTPEDFGAGGDTPAAAVLPPGAGSPGAFADSGLVRGGASYLPSSGGGPLAAPMPAGPPAAAPLSGAGPLAAPAVPGPGPGPAAAAPGPRGLLAPGAAPGTAPLQPPAMPAAPASHPEMQQYIYDIAKRGALAELAGLPNAYAPMLQALQGSPQYKALVEGATEYAKRSVGLGFIAPEKAAERSVTEPSDIRIKEAQARLDRETNALNEAVKAGFDMTTIPRDLPGGGQRDIPATRAQAALAAQGYAVPELGIPGKPLSNAPPGGLGPNSPAAQEDRGIGKRTYNPAQIKGQELGVTAGWKALEDTHARELEAGRQVQLFGQMAEAMEGFKPGATAETRTRTYALLKDLGVIEGDQVAPAEAFQRATRQLQLIAGSLTKGSTSDYERGLLAEGSSQMSNTPEGAAKAIQIGLRLAQRDIQVAQIHRDAVGPDGLPNVLEAQRRIAALGPPLSAGELRSLEKIREGKVPTPGQQQAPVGPVAPPRSGEALIPPPGLTIPPGATYLGFVDGVHKIKLPNGKTQSWTEGP